ncbi:hypothetical protein [Streptomyces longwoodensis]|uniref:hypothetical protein n=1 Tax=Streptomyces longwoodensis TaxID=68231 RepID=UPI00225C2AAA|nr:hypothetical protein [Streptomyces longwoodensis]MCX4993862.1 hypothetical protein [Streptomyces longwoodensis]MCX4998018.1 hypothetical protein [Streptomyces longwoodensis]
MPQPQPSIGRIVHYKVTAQDAEQINRCRKDFHESRSADQRTGFAGHVGNRVEEGDVFPAMIVRVWHESTVTVNAQVFLDGTDVLWATSRAEGTEPGTWAWPERV